MAEEHRKTDQEILTKLAVLTERVSNFQVETNNALQAVLAQTTKTNGRVSALEIWRATLSGKIAAYSMIIGAFTSVLVALIINKLS